jgi:hypothetical protein
LPYLHHYYSAEIQKYYGIDISSVHNGLLHPEWTTWINAKDNAETDNAEEHQFSKYERDDAHYYTKDKGKGTPRYVGFAIGEYDDPEFAIELYTNNVIKSEEIGYKILKLTDEDNPFKYVISFNLIFREKGLTVKVWEKNTKAALNNILEQRKSDNYKTKQFLFWVVEVSEESNRSWFIDNEHTEIQKGIPI